MGIYRRPTTLGDGLSGSASAPCSWGTPLYTGDGPESQLGFPTVFPEPHGNAFWSDSVHYSWAPLEDVVWAEVFYVDHRDDGGRHLEFCRGVVFRYKNGGSRAVGQVRLHVDRSRRFVRPTHVITDTEASEAEYLLPELKFFPKPEGDLCSRDSNLPDGPHCVTLQGRYIRPMKGALRFWFTARQGRVEIHQDKDT